MQRSFKPNSLTVNIFMTIKLHVKRQLEGRFIVSRTCTCELKGRGSIGNLLFGQRWDRSFFVFNEQRRYAYFDDLMGGQQEQQKN